MIRPNFISETDWQLVTSICQRYNVDPYLIAAIGKHETQWGTAGAGKIGWILGYGYFPGSTVKEKYKGLENQVIGALNQFSKYMQSPLTLQSITDLAVNHWKSSAPGSWAKSVYSIYISIAGGYNPPVTDTEIQDLTDRITELENKVTVDIDTGIADLTKRVSLLEMIIKFIKEFFESLGKEL